jgi:hypothetical protein
MRFVTESQGRRIITRFVGIPSTSVTNLTIIFRRTSGLQDFAHNNTAKRKNTNFRLEL